MFVCCVLSGSGLCDGLNTRPEESYRLWRSLCVIKKPRGRGGHNTHWAAVPKMIIIIMVKNAYCFSCNVPVTLVKC
jgi:hypothetical protein